MRWSDFILHSIVLPVIFSKQQKKKRNNEKSVEPQNFQWKKYTANKF